MKFTHHSFSHLGKVRSINEDAYGDIPLETGHVFVVCDGMGGHVGGAIASQLAVQTILAYFKEQKTDSIPTQIEASIQSANKAILAYAAGKEELKGMGTTVLVFVIHHDTCFIGHVGDSRIYLFEDQKLNRLTKDHSFVQNLVDQGLISEEEAEVHPKKNQILKALGISEKLEVSIPPAPILAKNGSIFMLCSDGLSGLVNDPSMAMMLDTDDLEQANKTLLQAALDSGGTDNITSTLVKITESSHQKSEFISFHPREIKEKQIESNRSTSEVTKSTNRTKTNWVSWVIGGSILLAALAIYIYFNT